MAPHVVVVFPQKRDSEPSGARPGKGVAAVNPPARGILAGPSCSGSWVPGLESGLHAQGFPLVRAPTLPGAAAELRR